MEDRVRNLVVNVPMNRRHELNDLIEKILDNDLSPDSLTVGMAFVTNEGHLKWSVTNETVSIQYIKHK
jgi:hypothetical protein